MSNSVGSLVSNNRNGFLLLWVIIFLTASVASTFSVLTLVFKHLFNLDSLISVELFTAFAGLLYCASIIGGLLGARVISYVSSINLGVCLCSMGLLGLYFYSFSGRNLYCIVLCLSFLLVGYGLITPCVISVFGENAKRQLIKANHFRSKFVLNYMSMNIGGVLGISFSALWSTPEANRNNFLIAFFLVILAAISFNYVWRRLHFSSTDFLRGPLKKIVGLILLLMSVVGAMFLLISPLSADIFLMLLTFFSVGYVLWLAKGKSDKHLKQMWIFIGITAATVIFFVLYNLEPDILSIFIEDYVNRHWLGLTIPAATYFMLNPLCNLLFGGVLLWILMKVKKSLAPDIWIYLAIFLMGVGFWILWFSTHFVGKSGISTNWIVLVYAFLSAAEMLVAPIAYEIVFIYGTPNLYGMMTGISQLAIGIGAFLTQRLSTLIVPKNHGVSPEALHSFSHGFKLIGIAWMMMGGGFLLIRFLRSLDRANE